MKLAELDNKQKLVFGAVILLVLLNIWRWWPESEATAYPARVTSANNNIIDERLLDRIDPKRGKEVRIGRNIFVSVTKSRLSTSSDITNKSEPVVAQTTHDDQHSNLNKFKLEGILDEEGKKQALLSKADKVFIVSKGQKFATHYRVERIELDRIQIKDNVKGVKKWIRFSGE